MNKFPLLQIARKGWRKIKIIKRMLDDWFISVDLTSGSLDKL
jgi:hypothetical protein